MQTSDTDKLRYSHGAVVERFQLSNLLFFSSFYLCTYLNLTIHNYSFTCTNSLN